MCARGFYCHSQCKSDGVNARFPTFGHETETSRERRGTRLAEINLCARSYSSGHMYAQVNHLHIPFAIVRMPSVAVAAVADGGRKSALHAEFKCPLAYTRMRAF